MNELKRQVASYHSRRAIRFKQHVLWWLHSKPWNRYAWRVNSSFTHSVKLTLLNHLLLYNFPSRKTPQDYLRFLPLVREQWLVLLSLLPVLEGVARIRPLPIHISFCGAFIGDSVSWASGSPYPSCTIRPHARQVLLPRHVAAHPRSGHGDVQHHCARPAVSSEDCSALPRVVARSRLLRMGSVLHPAVGPGKDSQDPLASHHWMVRPCAWHRCPWVGGLDHHRHAPFRIPDAPPGPGRNHQYFHPAMGHDVLRSGFQPGDPLAKEAGIPSSAHSHCIVRVDSRGMGKTARVSAARVLVLRGR